MMPEATHLGMASSRHGRDLETTRYCRFFANAHVCGYGNNESRSMDVYDLDRTRYGAYLVGRDTMFPEETTNHKVVQGHCWIAWE